MSKPSAARSSDAGIIARTLLDVASLAQQVDAMLPGFDRQMRVSRDAAAAAQLADAHSECKAVLDTLEHTWAAIEPTVRAVLEARPEIPPGS